MYGYFISLGSNLGNREANLRGGWDRLRPVCASTRLSRIYETRPMYVADQPLYLNAVGEAFSALTPLDMLRHLQAVERDFGRDRAVEVRRGARTLDLDILLCGSLIVQTPDLVIPHPLLAERLFVLVPLLELAPELADPRSGRPFGETRRALENAAGGDGGVVLHSAEGYTDPSK